VNLLFERKNAGIGERNSCISSCHDFCIFSTVVTVGTQAAVLAGLDITMFIEFNAQPNSEWVSLGGWFCQLLSCRIMPTDSSLYPLHLGRRLGNAATVPQILLLLHHCSGFLRQYDCGQSNDNSQCLGGWTCSERSRWKHDDSD
jgi:hypothetical protein